MKCTDRDVWFDEIPNPPNSFYNRVVRFLYNFEKVEDQKERGADKEVEGGF